MKKSEYLSEGIRIVQEEVSSLTRTLNSLSEDFADAIELLLSARKVIVCGIGKSGIIAQKIVATLNSTGTMSAFLHPVEALHGDIGIVEQNDVVIVLSKSGTTSEIVAMMPFLRSRSVKSIGILGSIQSPISEYCDVVLDASVEREACIHNLAPSNSTTVALALGDALALTLMRAKNFTSRDFSVSHPLGQLGRNMTLKVADVMHRYSSLPLVLSNTTLQSALIEMTLKKIGCVCVVNESQKLLGLLTDGDIRRILQQYDDFKALNVGEVMTKDPIVVSPQILLGEALAIMEERERQLNVLPVVDSGQLVGVIRVHDILRSER